MELPREPVFYPRNEGISIEIKSETEKTLQSIDSTLKRIEAILLQIHSQNQSYALDAQIIWGQMEASQKQGGNQQQRS